MEQNVQKKMKQEKNWTASSLYVVNCFKYFLIYILEQNVQKKMKQEKNWTASSLYVVNCFKYFLIYILRQNVSRKWGKKTISSFHV